MNDKKANIIMFTLFGIILLVWIAMNSSIRIDITRKYSDTTYIMTRDGLKGEVYWTTQYVAPIILPKEIKIEAKENIKLYADMTFKSFFMVRLSHPLSEYRVDQVQLEFNEQDDLQRKFARILKMERFENLKNLKQIQIDSIRYENHQDPDTYTNTFTSWK
jgi:hypothetical protein